MKKPISHTEIDIYKAIFERLFTGIVEKNMSLSEYYYKSNNYELSELLRTEIDGGNCTRCNKPWKVVKIKNTLFEGKYYVPDCECFIRCPICYVKDLKYYDTVRLYGAPINAILWREELSGYLKKRNMRCPKCGWQLVKEVKKAHGKEFESTLLNLKRWELMKMLMAPAGGG